MYPIIASKTPKSYSGSSLLVSSIADVKKLKYFIFVRALLKDESFALKFKIIFSLNLKLSFIKLKSFSKIKNLSLFINEFKLVIKDSSLKIALLPKGTRVAEPSDVVPAVKKDFFIKVICKIRIILSIINTS